MTWLIEKIAVLILLVLAFVVRIYYTDKYTGVVNEKYD